MLTAVVAKPPKGRLLLVMPNNRITETQDEEDSWLCVYLDMSLNRLRGIDAISGQPSLHELVSPVLQTYICAIVRIPMQNAVRRVGGRGGAEIVHHGLSVKG